MSNAAAIGLTNEIIVSVRDKKIRDRLVGLTTAALAAERKATVKRIRAALGVPLWHVGPRHAYFDMEKVLATLDAEAAK